MGNRKRESGARSQEWYPSSSGPAAAHMRQLKRLAIKIAQVRWWSEEISSAGTLTKVEAQYEVLGNEAKNRSVPLGTIEKLGFWCCTWLSDCQHFVDRPFRDG
jgi:hypothetical protein